MFLPRTTVQIIAHFFAHSAVPISWCNGFVAVGESERVVVIMLSIMFIFTFMWTVTVNFFLKYGLFQPRCFIFLQLSACKKNKVKPVLLPQRKRDLPLVNSDEVISGSDQWTSGSDHLFDNRHEPSRRWVNTSCHVYSSCFTYVSTVGINP